ncbi:MAG: TlpA family protein disulfide reductase [bacterium]
MKKTTKFFIIIIASIICCIVFSTGRIYGLIGPGDLFPEMDFDITLNKTAQKYLKTKKGREISLSDIKADIIMIEVLSVYCVSCMSQTSYDRELFLMIEDNENTAGKVKMIGIAAGNNMREVNKFVEEFNVPYPVFPDFKFSKYDQIGQVRTPFKIFLLKRPDNKFQVMKTELGVNENVKDTFDTIVDILEGKHYLDKKIETAATEPKPIDQAWIDNLLKEWLTLRGETISIKELFEDSGRIVYKIGSKEDIFAILINRPSTCDVCEHVQFIYMIDRLGTVLDLIPIKLSKLYNASFDENDIIKIKKGLIARNVREGITFTPQVDAISSATITSVLVYDSINKGAKIYDLLLERGFIQ